MALSFLRRRPSERERALGNRLPPGQYLTEKWPVLHYGWLVQPMLPPMPVSPGMIAVLAVVVLASWLLVRLALDNL